MAGTLSSTVAIAAGDSMNFSVSADASSNSKEIMITVAGNR